MLYTYTFDIHEICISAFNSNESEKRIKSSVHLIFFFLLSGDQLMIVKKKVFIRFAHLITCGIARSMIRYGLRTNWNVDYIFSTLSIVSIWSTSAPIHEKLLLVLVIEGKLVCFKNSTQAFWN